MTEAVKRLNLVLTTTSGDVEVEANVPTSFIRITDIVPAVRSIGEQAHEEEIASVRRRGGEISCQKGCSFCCEGLMVAVSPPEAFLLNEMMQTLPVEHRKRIENRLAATRRLLDEAGLFQKLVDLAESEVQQSDERNDSLNRDYYALRLPCVFLEDSTCSIYEHRPSACREHLVTSPAELCENTAENPVKEVPIPVRAGTVLSILWSDVRGGPVRLIPLPVAFEWAKRHDAQLEATWNGLNLFDHALEGLGKFLRQSLKSVTSGRAVAGE